MWDPLRTRAIPERLRGVYTTRRYTNPRLPYLTLPNVMHIIAKAFLSVCLSVKRVDCDKTKENCAHIRTPHERSFIIIFRKKNGWWWATHYTWNFWSNWPCWSENADFQSIFACSASAVTPSEKSSININRKSKLSSEPKINSVRCLSVRCVHLSFFCLLFLFACVVLPHYVVNKDEYNIKMECPKFKQ